MTTDDTGTEIAGGTAGHELEETLRHALALAGKKWAVDRVHEHVDQRVPRAGKLTRLLPHLIAYGALLGYIIYRHEHVKDTA